LCGDGSEVQNVDFTTKKKFSLSFSNDDDEYAYK